MKLCVVYDKKSGDMLAPQFVAGMPVAIRNYTAMAEDDPKVLFARFPEDYALRLYSFVEGDVNEPSCRNGSCWMLVDSVDFSTFISKKEFDNGCEN